MIYLKESIYYRFIRIKESQIKNLWRINQSYSHLLAEQTVKNIGTTIMNMKWYRPTIIVLSKKIAVTDFGGNGVFNVWEIG